MNAHYPQDYHPLAPIIRQLRGTISWLTESGVSLDQTQIEHLMHKVRSLELRRPQRDERVLNIARYWTTLPYQEILNDDLYRHLINDDPTEETSSEQSLVSNEPLPASNFPAVIHRRSVIESISFEQAPPLDEESDGSAELMTFSPSLENLRGLDSLKSESIQSQSNPSISSSETTNGFGFVGIPTSAHLETPLSPPKKTEQLWATKPKESIKADSVTPQISEKRGQAFARLTSKNKGSSDTLNLRAEGLLKTSTTPISVPVTKHVRSIGFNEDQLFGEICDQIWSCQACPRYNGTHHVGQGHYGAELMFVVAHPSERDLLTHQLLLDREERHLFNNVLKAMSLSRMEIYLTALLRCGTGTPQPHEWDKCQQHFIDELQLVRPKVIIALGYLSSVMLLGPHVPQGQWGYFQEIDVMPTLHPADIINGGSKLKRSFWNHMRIVMRKAGLNPNS